MNPTGWADALVDPERKSVGSTRRAMPTTRRFPRPGRLKN